MQYVIHSFWILFRIVKLKSIKNSVQTFFQPILGLHRIEILSEIST